MIHEPHVVQSRATDLALRALDNLHALNIRVEHLHRHLDGNAGELIAEQEGSVNSAQFDAQHNTVERVTVLESDADDITGLDTAGVPAVVEQSLALTLGVKGLQLRLGDLGDGVFACFAGGGGRSEDLNRFGSCNGPICQSIDQDVNAFCYGTYRSRGASELVLVIGIARGDSEGEGGAGGAESRRLRGNAAPFEVGRLPGSSTRTSSSRVAASLVEPPWL